MGLGGVHRLCVVGPLGGKKLRSHRLSKARVGCGGRRGVGSLFFPDPKRWGQRNTGTQGTGPSWGSASMTFCANVGYLVLGSVSGPKSKAQPCPTLFLGLLGSSSGVIAPTPLTLILVN